MNTTRYPIRRTTLLQTLHFFSLLCCFVLSTIALSAQNDIHSTNARAEKVLLGNYAPGEFRASLIVSDPSIISRAIDRTVSPDSMHSYLNSLASFQNRNTASDTNSSVRGIGAARRWAYAKFEEISRRNENRLITSYLQFQDTICSVTQHRNVYALLPGSDTNDKSIVIIEAHLDSRCAEVCDTLCLAQGMEDNGSGCALVIELARVMSAYTFNHSVVFLLTIGEEQALNGATAFALYCKEKGIAVKAVLNNDVVGGVFCGKTSSPPGCSTPNGVDSTQVRLFSNGGFNSSHKQLARYIKLQYKEQLSNIVRVPMMLTIMSAEDRTNRGGDHMPFRAKAYTAMRFTSANEHGDASNVVGYTDRQHTSSDVLGIDTNNDQQLDSFYVDFSYCTRNAVINGCAASMIALSPAVPDFELDAIPGARISVRIAKQNSYKNYRIALRTKTNDWDSVYTVGSSEHDTLFVPEHVGSGTTFYYVSVASVDSNGIESMFSKELLRQIGSTSNASASESNTLQLLQNKPNPFDESTIISVVSPANNLASAFIRIYDETGSTIANLPLQLHEGVNDVLFDHGFKQSGVYFYSLIVDERVIETRKMIFAN